MPSENRHFRICATGYLEEQKYNNDYFGNVQYSYSFSGGVSGTDSNLSNSNTAESAYGAYLYESH